MKGLHYIPFLLHFHMQSYLPLTLANIPLSKATVSSTYTAYILSVRLLSENQT